MAESFDTVVVGAGAGGLTAGLFACRYGLKTVVLERSIPGGQVINAEKIENFPGFPEGISGAMLGPSIQEQAMQCGLDTRMSEATALKTRGPYHVVETTDGELVAKAVIVAGGSALRKLKVPGEEEFNGRGVSYCGSCDGPFFTNQTVAVVGGGDSAMDEAITLTQYTSQVLVLHRDDRFHAQKVLRDRVLGHPSIKVHWNTEVTAIKGDAQVNSVAVRDTKSGETSEIPLSAVFIFIGLDPNSSWLKGVLPVDNAGHIPTDMWMQTPVPGLFAAGDIRQHSAAQLVTAAGDGATAAIAAYRYIAGKSWPQG